MNINIPYGKKQVNLKIPSQNMIRIKSCGKETGKTGEKEIVSDALARPIDAKPLHQLAEGKKDAVILASDITRPCPSYKFLPDLVGELHRGGIDYDKITVIFGLGIHRKHTREEKNKLAGKQICRKVRLMDSDPKHCTLIGKTTRGTPVEVFKQAVNSDLLIATGNIEYHYFAGYSGGAKALMPGICSKASIQANHGLMFDEKSVAGSFHSNPLRQDIEEAGRLAQIDFIFNVILDDHKNIISAVSGSNPAAFLKGINTYDAIYKMEVDQKADLVITSPGGYPKDINLYQSQKALENIKGIVKEQGKILFIAQCQEGFGEETFEQWMTKSADYATLKKKIRENFVLGGHKAVAVAKMLAKNEVFLYSDFNEHKTRSMGFQKLNNIQQQIIKTLYKNNDARVVVIPTGRLVKYNKLK